MTPAAFLAGVPRISLRSQPPPPSSVSAVPVPEPDSVPETGMASNGPQAAPGEALGVKIALLDAGAGSGGSKQLSGQLFCESGCCVLLTRRGMESRVWN